MGYYSTIYLKTTTEGFILLKKAHDSISDPEQKTLHNAEIEQSSSGFYKIKFEEIKWYESFPQVKSFNRVLQDMKDKNIPYSFISIGEDIGDIVCDKNYTDDMPYEIDTFEPLVDINDEDRGYVSLDLDSDAGSVWTEAYPV